MVLPRFYHGHPRLQHFIKDELLESGTRFSKAIKTNKKSGVSMPRAPE